MKLHDFDFALSLTPTGENIGIEWIPGGVSVKIIKSLGMAAAMASCLAIFGSPAQAIEVTSTNVTFNINGFGGPICELTTEERIILGNTEDTFFLNDGFYSGVTDASGTIGINNLGQPDPRQGRSVQVGSTTIGLGFIDRANIMDPMFLTIWEAVIDPNTNQYVVGPILAQIPIPQSAIGSGPFPCVPPNSPPTADAGQDQGPLLPGATATLDGSASSDPDNDTLSYAWTQTSGPTVTLSDPTAAMPSFTIPASAAGLTLTFDLVVNDGTASSSADSVSISVRSNAAPVADAGNDLQNVVPGTQVTLDGRGSSDPDGDALTYSWTQVSGPTVTLSGANTATPSFIAPRESGGAPVVLQLVVNDGSASSSADTVSISVIDNVSAAQQAITSFMAQRANLILSLQPDLQRRIDRFSGERSPGGSSVAGLAIPGSDRLPVRLTASGGQFSGLGSAALMEGSGDDGIRGSVDIWAEAYISPFDYSGREGDATIVYGGIDMAVFNDLLVGIMGQYDAIDFDTAVTSGVLDGEGWMVGPYATARLAPALFLDARAAFGSSKNTISPFGTYTDDFDANRTLLSATLTGQFRPAKGLTLRPEANLSWLRESSESYIDGLGSTVGGVDAELGQVSFAPRAMYDAPLSSGWMLRPFLEARGIFSWGSDRSLILDDSFRMRIEGGLDLFSERGFRASLSGFHDGIGQSDFAARGAHITLGFGL